MEKLSPLQYVLLIVVAALAGWIAWVIGSPSGAPLRGILCESMEGKAVHIHAQLQLWKDGKAVTVPADVGQGPGCFYWLHTHTSDGILHIESPSVRAFTLGDFFAVWGQNPWGSGEVSAAPGVKLWIKKDGEKQFHEFQGDWSTVVLTTHELLALGTGDFVPQDFTFPDGT